MKSSKYRRFLSLILSVSLLSSISITSVSAIKGEQQELIVAKTLISEAANKNLSAANSIAVAADLEVLSNRNIDVNSISISDVDNAGNVTYAYQLSNDLTSYINTWEEKDGSEVIQYQEGALQNTVRYAPDGKIFLDGNEVCIYTDSLSQASSNNVSRAGFYSIFQSLPPNKTVQSNYDNGAKTVYDSTAMIYFGAAVTTITIGALTGIIGGMFSAAWAQALGASVSAGALSTIADYLKDKHPYGSYFSFKDYRVAQKTGTKPVLELNFRHDIEVSSKTSQAGATTTTTLKGDYYEIRIPT